MRLAPIKRLASDIIELCYPSLCAACDEPAEQRVHRLCDTCEVNLGKLELAGACQLCGMPLAEPGAPCPFCRGKGVPHYERVIRLGVFLDPLKHLIHLMKYHGRWSIAELLADRMTESRTLKALLQENHDATVIVPVPLHPWRQISRGYNQSELIARRIGSRCDIKLVDALVRLKNTETQTQLHSHEKREENLRDAFALARPNSITGRHVIVVDDVMTTGATMQAAARVMAAAKPASLLAIVLAVADPRHQDFQAI